MLYIYLDHKILWWRGPLMDLDNKKTPYPPKKPKKTRPQHIVVAEKFSYYNAGGVKIDPPPAVMTFDPPMAVMTKRAIQAKRACHRRSMNDPQRVDVRRTTEHASQGRYTQLGSSRSAPIAARRPFAPKKTFFGLTPRLARLAYHIPLICA